MTHSYQRLSEDPPKELLSWGLTWTDELRKRQQSVSVTVWVPGELARESAHCWDSGRCRLTRLADYLLQNLGFEVCTTGGWSCSGSSFSESVEELARISVPVRIKGVRAALAAQAS